MNPDVFLHCDHNQYTTLLRYDARAGLTASRPRLPARWCFDGRGRHLFAELIREQGPHLWSAEADTVADRADAIASLTGARQLVHIGQIEPWTLEAVVGKLLAAGCLEALSICDTPHTDVTTSAPLPPWSGIDQQRLVAGLPDMVPPLPPPGPRLVYCPSTTVAPLSDKHRQGLWQRLRKRCDAGDHLLLAAPQHGTPAWHLVFFEAATDFNRNVINVLNHVLDADVSETAFEHAVGHDSASDRLELSLRARGQLRMELRTLGFSVDFEPGDQLRTFTMRGFSSAEITRELDQVGFDVTVWWWDPDQRVHLLLAEAT